MTRHLPALCLTMALSFAAPIFAQQQPPATAPAPAPPAAPAPAPAAAPAEGQDVLEQGRKLWEDYIHYIRIAQMDLAKSAGQAFVALQLSPEQTLRIVDELSPYRDYQETLIRAQRMEGEIAQLAQQVENKVRTARLALSREDVRIRDAITSLDDGLRARLNAVERLQKAGEYAAPAMLNVLLSTEAQDRQLQPYVIEAMVEVGRPIVGPLSIALADLPEVAKQQVAEVLGRIGYPQALPYLKAELESEKVQPGSKRVIQVAYDRIVERTGVPPYTDAASLFYLLAEDYYHNRASLMVDPTASEQLLWSYATGSGLTFQPLPAAIYGDVMAMRSARRSLQLNPNLSAALSLWLAANFRRENNLPEGQQDPSYAADMQSPHFYATLAGPRHVHPVLERALGEANAELALDAIGALRTTAGTSSLVNAEGNIQPLIAALTYPDRRVRYEAAFAIASSVPHASFPGAERVVPVLADAIREGARPYAVAIAPSPEDLNTISQLLGPVGQYQMVVGNSIDGVAAQITEAPSINLIVVNAPLGQAQAAVAAARQHYRLASVPIAVLATAQQQPALQTIFRDVPGVVIVNTEGGAEQVTAALQQTAAWSQGEAISPEQALAYAQQALALLQNLAESASQEFRASEAQAALLEALGDSREPVVRGAADVLALLPSPQAQQALANAALDTARGPEMQIAMLNDLAASARIHANQLTERQVGQIGQLVNTATGEMADAAAEVYGALNLPTERAVQVITQGRGQ